MVSYRCLCSSQLFQSQVSAGGEHQLGNIALDYRFSYSYGKELHPDQLSSEFRLRHIDFKLDFSDPQFPTYAVTNGVDEDIQVADVVLQGAALTKATFEILLEANARLVHISLL